VEAQERVIERLLRPAASSHALSLDAVLYSVHAHMLLIFVLWLAVFVYALIRFRRGAQPEPRREGVRGMWPAIAIGLVIAGDVVILAGLALPAWSERNQPPPPVQGSPTGLPPLEVRVTAEQFAWNIHYAGPDGIFGRIDAALISATNPVGIDRTDAAAKDDIGLLNVLTLPVDRTVVVQLSSRDVVHSFTLNEMRVKQDANPGMVSRVWFTPIATGQWEIACSQLCGMGHYRMRGEYRVVTREEWAQWQAEELARLP
jgi:cytochrome c oxidase subunit II